MSSYNSRIKAWLVMFMKRRTLILIFVLIPVVCSPATIHSQGHRTLRAAIETESGKRTVEIQYYPGSEEWAQGILNTIKEGFPLLEKRIGVVCPITYDIVVIETTELEEGVAAENRGRAGIFVPKNTTTSTILHELCHYWYGWQPHPDWSDWIAEGFCEAYTILVLRELRHPEGYDEWYGRLYQYEQAKSVIGDKPLKEVGYSFNFEDPRVDILYSKSMVFCYWVVLYFGEDVMQEINGEIIFMNSLDTEDFKDITEDVSEEDLDWFFSGWVYPGRYYYQGEQVTFEWYTGDGDKDGIDTFTEIETGSNPFVKDTDGDNVPDGYEYVLKTDVDNPDTDGDGHTDGEEIPIIIDGKNTEWVIPIINDKMDSDSPIPGDIKAVYYAADSLYMYFMIELYKQINTANQTGILFDVDNDGDANFIFFVFYDHLILGLWEDDEYTEITDPESLKGTYMIADEVIEIRIPKTMHQVRFPETVDVWADELYIGDEIITDETYSEFVSLDGTVEGTDPLHPDNGSSKDEEDLVPAEHEQRQEQESGIAEEAPITGETEAGILPEDTSLEPQPTELPSSEEKSRKTLLVVVIFLVFIVIIISILSRTGSRPGDFHEERMCPRCGHSNRADSYFCEMCGKSLRH